MKPAQAVQLLRDLQHRHAEAKDRKHRIGKAMREAETIESSLNHRIDHLQKFILAMIEDDEDWRGAIDLQREEEIPF